MERWADGNPGVPAPLKNSIAEAMRSSLFNSTVRMDIEFERRIPVDELRFTFTRVVTKMLDGGRMDLDVTICNEKMELLCISPQVVLVLEAQREFRNAMQKPSHRFRSLCRKIGTTQLFIL
jgi:hypothetical protein